MSSRESSTTTRKRPPRARSRPRRGSPPVVNRDETGLGDVYLDTFAPPALASTSEVYREVYASVRAILERYNWRHATTAVKATWDAAAASVTQSLRASGGQGR